MSKKLYGKRTLHWLILLLFFSNIHAEPLGPHYNSDFYYRVGGARSIAASPWQQAQSIRKSGSFELGYGYSCGKFDSTLGVANLLNSLGNLKNDLVNGVVGAVTTAIGSLPALILQRVNPGLYDLFQNGKIRAEALIALSDKSCQQMEQEIQEGKNPYSDWINYSKGIDWKIQMGKAEAGDTTADVHYSKEIVEENNGKNGIPWLEGTRVGGENQDPIKLIEDPMIAGYNLTYNRTTNDKRAVGGAVTDSRMQEVWKAPDDAVKFAVSLLGDRHIKTHDDHPVENITGHGLARLIDEDAKNVTENIIKLVNGDLPITPDNLNDVSSNATIINQDIIFALKDLDPPDQSIAIAKLASEAAMSRQLEQALFTRRMLLTALHEPHIAKSPAPPYIEDSIAKLDREVNDMLFEKRVHNELMADTSKTILELKGQMRGRSKAEEPPSGDDSATIEDGGAEK